MKLIREENSSKSYLIEHFDDLWSLSKFIAQGDIICSKTQRKVALGGDKKKQVTKIMYVELKVKKVELSSTHLKLLGEILNENEFTKVGAHHSLSYEVGESIEFLENTFSNKRTKYAQKIFDDALQTSKNKFIIVLCDVDSMVVAKCSQYSMDVLVEKNRLGQKKYFTSEKSKSGVEEMNEILNELHLEQFDTIVFGGPGNYKTQLKELYSRQHQNQQLHAIDVVDSEKSSLSIALDLIVKSKLIDEINQVKVDKKVEDFLQALHLGKNVSYGLDEVIEKIHSGACSEIIVSSQIYDILQDENTELLYLVEQMGGEIFVIDSLSKNGKIIDGLGGIVANLRY